MAATAEIEVFGVRDALKELGQIDKKLRFKAQNRMKAAGAELQNAARSAYPDNSKLQGDLKGWSTKGRLGYDKTKVDKGVQIQIGGRSYGNAYAIITLVQKDPGGALFDIAGLQNGAEGVGSKDKKGRARQPQQSKAFLNTLNHEYGRAQRGMWRKIKTIRQLASEEILKACEDIMEMVNRKLVA